MKHVTGFMCGPRIYKYNGWLFEYSQSSGPWPLKQDGEPRKCAGNKFYEMFEEFFKREDKESFREGGGCERIGLSLVKKAKEKQ